MDSVELMDTFSLGRGGVRDELEARLGPSPLTDRFRELRDALRRLAAEVVSDDRPAAAVPMDVTAAVEVVNRACASAPTWSELVWSPTPGRVSRSAHDSQEAELASIAEDAVDLFTGPRRTDLRACHGPGCVLYFLRDHPRREWCSAGCGNRARVARHYQRHHGGD
jgi:predicted RNA-binding Zn ribbon-like protein